MANETQEPQGGLELLENLQRVKGENCVHLYVNNTRVSFSQWDMKITFAEMVDRIDDKPVIEERAVIVMSLHHAKAAIAALVQSFSALEKQFGEIKLLERPQLPLSSKEKPPNVPPRRLVSLDE